MSLEKTFPIYKKTHASGNVGYRVDMGPIGGKRVFKSFATQEAAERFRQRCLETQKKKKPLDLRDLDDVMRHDVLGAVAKLREHNATIAQAVDFFLKHSRPAKANATIGEIMEQFKAVKQKSGRTAKYLDTSWKTFFVPFRDHFKNCEISDVTSTACELYFYKSKTWSATTRRSHLRHVSVLFNFAVERGYAGINPIDDVERPKKPPGTSRQRVVTVENVIKLLRYALDHGYKAECASLVLVLFCGVRVDEVGRLKWEDLSLDENPPVVILGEDVTKTGKTRINPIPKNALEWLQPLRDKGSITSANYEGRMRYLRQSAKAGFKQNSARICFASYHLARYEDAPKTAFLLGHDSPTLLYSTYKALVTKEAAIRYWKITPDYDGRNDVISVPSEAEIADVRSRALLKVLQTPRKD